MPEIPGPAASRTADVVLAVLAAAEHMGQQEYERRLHAGLVEGGTLGVQQVRVRSLRSSLPGEARVPMGSWAWLPSLARVALARRAYGPARLVHRCDLRLPPAASPEIVTVHDTAWLTYDDEARPPRGHGAALRRAALVVTPSRFAAQEVEHGLGVPPARIRVIPNGVADRFRGARPLTGEQCRLLGLPEHFLLHVGGSSQRKNLAALAQAWSVLIGRQPGLSLVLCGPPDARRQALFQDLPRTLLLGRVADALMPGLLASARAVVVPSSYEGFGLPVLEAMAAGTVVVAARAGSLPEVAGDSAILAEPDATGLVRGVERALELPDDSRLVAGARQRAATFTWARSVQLHEDLYVEILSRKR